MPATLHEIEKALSREQQEDLPLHSQVKRALRRLIREQFQNDERFYTETAIASQLGISAGTVRRALGDLTREGLLVRRVAQGTFVRKSDSVAGQKSATLYILVPQFDSESITCFVRAFDRLATSRSWRVEIHPTPRNQGAVDAASAIRHDPAQSYVVLLATVPDLTPGLNELLTARGYRTVTVDMRLPGFKGAYAGTDDESAIKIGLDHLVGLGHRRITLLVNEPNDQLSVSLKVDAFRNYVKQHGLAESSVALPPMARWDNPFDVAYSAMPQVWDQTVRPTAIMTLSDYGAFGAMKWLAEREIRIPQQVSVLGFENIPSSRYTHPALTTIDQDFNETARRAVDILLLDEARSELVPPKLVVRETTAPPAD